MLSWQRRRLWRTLLLVLVVIGALVYAWSIRPAAAPRANGRMVSPTPASPAPSAGPWAVTVLEDSAYLPSLIDDISNAKHSVSIALFVARLEPALEPLAAAIQDAARRGVEVRMLLDRSQNGQERHDGLNRQTGARYQEAGVSVRFDAPEVELHDKLVVVDGRIAYVGAHNWTKAALLDNRELSLRLEADARLDDAVNVFDERWAAGRDPGRIARMRDGGTGTEADRTGPDDDALVEDAE